MKYTVVTPVRNEEQHIGATLDSMARQTVKPLQWIIVDDGSSDRTPAIAQAAAENHPWIQLVQRPDRGFHQPGGGVVEAFYEGVRRIQPEDWRFLVKLDGDLTFAPDCFERCLEQFEMDDRLGICGGVICAKQNGVLTPESPDDPAFHVRGAIKIYRRECWEAIGGLLAAPGWDTLDEYKANMLGWVTYTIPDVKLLHLRKAGETQGTWKNLVKNGFANYMAGYHPLFMLAKCARRIFEKPYGVVPAGLFAGYVSGYLGRRARTEDTRLIGYLRDQQWRRLSFRQSLWDLRPALRLDSETGARRETAGGTGVRRRPPL